VLVRPRGGENVGSVCRAIKNMGAGRLVVVDPEFDHAGASKMAVHARDVLSDRLEVPDLVSAVAGCSLVIGTTARSGAYRQRSSDVRELCERAARETISRDDDLSALPAAFVFGPEDTGLTNEDIAVCHVLGFIPTSDEYQSLNLAQAVLVTLYEFRRAVASLVGAEATGETREQADAEQVEAMFTHLESALARVGFLSEDNPAHIMVTLRAMLARTGLDPREVRVLRGIARQVDWFAQEGRDVAIEKRRRGDKLR
jgi:tRNA/rRNA methyltransferase